MNIHEKELKKYNPSIMSFKTTDILKLIPSLEKSDTTTQKKLTEWS